MRFLELHLKAFGPFTDRRLDLSRGAHGLHLIFGPNEAGKSSALRALKALLYGVEERTTDTFLHGSDALRVGGRLRLGDGRELAFVRRKGRKNTVLTPASDERSLDGGEAALAPFLAGVNQSIFSTLFGIDHRALVEGGEQILRQKGDVGQTLFAAATGSRRLQTVLSELEAEAADLFRPHGSKYLINKAFADFKETRRAQKDAALAVKDWDAQQRALGEATEGLDVLQGKLAARIREKNAIERVRRIKPRVARRQELLAELAGMGAVVELAADFADRHRSLCQRAGGARETLTADREKLARLKQELARLVPPERILGEAGAIEALHQRLGSYRKSLADRPGIEGKRSQTHANAHELRKRLRADLTAEQAGALRPDILAARRPIQELAVRHQAVAAAERTARRSLDQKRKDIAELERELAALPADLDAGPLTRAASDARKAGDLDRLLREARRAEEKCAAQCQEELAALGLWQGPLAAVATLPVPTAETIERYERGFQESEDGRRRLAEDRGRILQEVREVERSLTEMRLAGAVPTEDDLGTARARRDAGWALVKRAWREGADVADEAREYDASRDLAAAYEASVGAVDEVADRLRREADRVAHHAERTARRDELAATLEDVAAREAEQSAAAQALLAQWEAVWAPSQVHPWPPKEMRAWLRRLESLRERSATLSERRGKVAELQEAIAGYRAVLGERLEALGADPPAAADELAPWLEAADAAVERFAAVAIRRGDLRRLTREQAKAEGEHAQAAADLEAWNGAWRDAVAPLGQPADAGPAPVQSLLETYGELFKKMDDEDELGRRLYGIGKDIEEFEAEARRFVREVAPDLEDADAARCVERLNDALKDANAVRTKRETLEVQARELDLRIKEFEAKEVQAAEGLDALLREAGRARVEELAEAERRSEEYRQLREQAAELERAILEAGEGAALDVLVAEATGTDADDLPARLDALQQEMEELEEERGRQREAKGAAESELRRMTGAATAAQKAHEAQEILASLRGHVEHYLRVRTAALVLRKEIERYREANQDPLLVRGGELFAALTRGAFGGLGSEFTADDEPRLVGVRPDGKTRVPAEGMSSGTRDQLYLALRLATLEQYLARSEPLPFVVDDILINFDDDRACSTLDVLARFATRTQVLLFTHHERIREMAHTLGEANGVFVLHLP